MTGEEIQRNLVDFARKWSLYEGSERAEAQTFLNELFGCYGTDRYDAGARFEEAQERRFPRPPVAASVYAAARRLRRRPPVARPK